VSIALDFASPSAADDGLCEAQRSGWDSEDVASCLVARSDTGWPRH
jgi:hypothetical protein